VSEIIRRISKNIGSKKLGNVLSATQIKEFEEEHKISLPSDYKEFLMEVGNGGDGPPEYGLLKLGEIKKHNIPDYLLEGYKERLKKPFPLTEHWIWEGMEDEPGFGEKLRETENGSLALGHDGCGMFWLLIVTGQEKGKIWQTTDVGICPCSPSLTFTLWYEKWLSGKNDWWEVGEP